MSARGFPFGKAGPAPVARAPEPSTRITVELHGYTPPAKVLPFADPRATVQMPRPPIPAPPRIRPRRRGLAWAVVAVVVVLFDVLAAWLILRRPS